MTPSLYLETDCGRLAEHAIVMISDASEAGEYRVRYTWGAEACETTTSAPALKEFLAARSKLQRAACASVETS